MLVPLCNWYLPFVECKTKNQNSSLAKMKLLAVSSVIVTFSLLPVLDCASVSLSSSQLSLEGNAYIRVIFFCLFCSLVLEFGYCSMVSWLYLFSLIYVIYEFNKFLHRARG